MASQRGYASPQLVPVLNGITCLYLSPSLFGFFPSLTPELLIFLLGGGIQTSKNNQHTKLESQFKDR
jgi:hypothetical protein